MAENTQENEESTSTGFLEPGHIFQTPTKQIKGPEEVVLWENSEAYIEYLTFVMKIGEVIRGKKIRDVVVDDVGSKTVKGLVAMLDDLKTWIDEIPLEEQQQRFGNKAFRKWYRRVEESSTQMLNEAISITSDKVNPEFKIGAISEIKVYFMDSFGNPTRVDYGTGHEMAFVMFLSCLFKIGALCRNNIKELEAVGLLVFSRYMNLVRKLQHHYRMEPAGSQGVWSLDDFQFIPFIWGASQLIGHNRLKPKSLSDYDIAKMMADDFHLFACIKYIFEEKTGPFAEHSNQLWNVSAVPFWDKVYKGLVKMYRAEVLSKYPIIQHTFFGSMYKLDPALKEAVALLANVEPPSTSGSRPRMAFRVPGVPTARPPMGTGAN